MKGWLAKVGGKCGIGKPSSGGVEVVYPILHIFTLLLLSRERSFGRLRFGGFSLQFVLLGKSFIINRLALLAQYPDRPALVLLLVVAVFPFIGLVHSFIVNRKRC